MDYIAEFKNIIYHYDGNEQAALNGFSMNIPLGKKCVLLGANGSGKSTAFHVANGLVTPDEGEIFWKGKQVKFNKKELRQLRRFTGLFFQNAEEMLLAPTVVEDLSYGLINAGLAGKELQEKVDQVVADFNLNEIKNRPIHHLSLGEKRRVALAGVISLQPELLLLDEPTTYLDPRQQKAFIAELNKIHHFGTTIVLSTHDLEFAYEWADWVFIMKKGQICFTGLPDDFFRNESLVLQSGLTVPLLFQLKQLLKQQHWEKSEIAMEELKSKEEVLLYLNKVFGNLWNQP